MGASKDFLFFKKKKRQSIAAVNTSRVIFFWEEIGLAWIVHTIMSSNCTVPVLIPKDLIVCLKCFIGRS